MGLPDQSDLFPELPEVRVPEAAGRGLPRLRVPIRNQIALHWLTLDELLPPDHRARQVWSFVERLDLSALYRVIKATEGRPGHPCGDPRLLMGLWLYATIEQVGSARLLDRLCREHLGFRWMCGGVSLNHHTLSNFRVAHPEILEDLLTCSFAACLEAGLAAQERAARERQARVMAALQAVEALTGHPPDGSAEARPPQEPPRQGPDARALEPPALAPPSGAKAKEPRASTTDVEARVMKMADGGFRPAFNVQFATATDSQLIAAVAIGNVGSDQGQLAPMVEHLVARYGRQPHAMLVDGGFTKLADIEAVSASGETTIYAPVMQPRDPERDPHAPRPGDTPRVAAWRGRMATAAAKTIYKQRAATAECVNALARNRGLQRFPVRGLAKAKAVALWFALAHNLARIISLRPATA